MNTNAALVLLIKELQEQINEIASLKRQGYSAKLSLELFRESAAVLRTLSPELKDRYFKYLLTLFSSSNTMTSRRQVSEKYVGLIFERRREHIAGLSEKIRLSA